MTGVVAALVTTRNGEARRRQRSFLPFLVLADDNGKDPIRTKNAGRVTAEQSLSPERWATFCRGVNRIAASDEQNRMSTTVRSDSVRPRWKLGAQTALAGLALAIVGLGWIDFLTGPDIGFSLFYLIPIVLAGWYLGARPAAALATEAAIAWFWAELLWKGEALAGVSVWNGITRLGIYLAMGLLTAKVRRDHLIMAELLERSERLARTDPLTGLPNSRCFFEYLHEEAHIRLAGGLSMCIAYLDADNFKRVNDGFGHEAGDMVLIKMANTIRKNIRDGDFTARLGGDEFVILFLGVTLDAAEEAARRITVAVREMGCEYPGTDLGASIGLVRADGAPVNFEEVLRKADNAMYEAKHLGRGRVFVGK